MMGLRKDQTLTERRLFIFGNKLEVYSS